MIFLTSIPIGRGSGIKLERKTQSLGWQLELPLRRNNPLPMVADLFDKNSRSSGLVPQFAIIGKLPKTTTGSTDLVQLITIIRFRGENVRIIPLQTEKKLKNSATDYRECKNYSDFTARRWANKKWNFPHITNCIPNDTPLEKKVCPLHDYKVAMMRFIKSIVSPSCETKLIFLARSSPRHKGFFEWMLLR